MLACFEPPGSTLPPWWMWLPQAKSTLQLDMLLGGPEELAFLEPLEENSLHHAHAITPSALPPPSRNRFNVRRNMMACRARSLPVLLLYVVVLLHGGGCHSGGERESRSSPMELSIGVRAAPDSGLIAIADDKGYFRKAGVKVATTVYPSGRQALEAMVRGEVQLATVADIAFASMMLENSPVRVVASIGFSTASQIVARKDRNIRSPSDLRGKRVGYSPDTTSDYFLHTFLLIEHIPPREIVSVPIPPHLQATSVINGDLDAVSAFDEYAFEAKKGLGERAVFWDCQNNMGYQWLLAAGESLTGSPEALKRFLGALLEAEEFSLANQDEAKKIVIRKLDLDPELVEDSWSKIRLSVSFSQSVIDSLRSYSKWKLVKEGQSGDPPDALDFIDTGALDGVAPKVVTIFR